VKVLPRQIHQCRQDLRLRSLTNPAVPLTCKTRNLCKAAAPRRAMLFVGVGSLMTWSFNIGFSIPGVFEHWAACLNISSSKLKKESHHSRNARLDIVYDRDAFQ
jgi:hypothetical protein